MVKGRELPCGVLRSSSRPEKKCFFFPFEADREICHLFCAFTPAATCVFYHTPGQRSPFSEVEELANKDRLHTTDPGIVLLVRQPSAPPYARRASLGGSYGQLIERRAYSHLCATAHAPLGHAGLPFHGLLPSGNRTPHAYARMLLPVVATQLLEGPSMENAAEDGPVAHHHVALARRARHRRQHRLLQPSPGDASRKKLHLAFHWSFQPPSRHVCRHSGRVHRWGHG